MGLRFSNTGQTLLRACDSRQQCDQVVCKEKRGNGCQLHRAKHTLLLWLLFVHTYDRGLLCLLVVVQYSFQVRIVSVAGWTGGRRRGEHRGRSETSELHLYFEYVLQKMIHTKKDNNREADLDKGTVLVVRLSEIKSSKSKYKGRECKHFV